MTTNGIDLQSEGPLEDDLLARVRAEVLTNERMAIVRERETLTLRYRVQKRIGANQAQLDELLKALEQCEQAMDELDLIAHEWNV